MATITTTCGTPITVDDEDMERILGFKWYLLKGTKNGTTYMYATTRVKAQTIYMHRLITSAPKNMVVDHINNDGLDNRRSNLRLCSQSENMRNRGIRRNNTTGTAGVYLRSYGKYEVNISLNKKKIHVGVYATIEEARSARANAVSMHYGEFVHKSEL
ncbi:MAG: HNH endonuclease [Thermomicrobiales bacterium]